MTDEVAATAFSRHAPWLLLGERFWRLTCLSLALCLIWGVGLFCVHSLHDAWQGANWAEHAQDVGFETDRLRLLLRDSETAQRGYLLTGNNDFLEPYDSALKDAPATMARLRELTADNADQQQRVNRLEQLVRRQLDISRYNIRKRQSKGAEAVEIGSILNGKLVMEEIEKLTLAMMEEENRLYRMRTDDVKRQATFATLALFVGLLLSTAVIGLMFQLMGREIGRRRLVEAELKFMNATLEQRVGDRTADLQSEIAVRQQAEEKLQDTRIFLDTVIENLPGMLCIKDAKDNRFVLLNRAGEKLLGHNRRNFVGKTDYDFFPEDQAHSFVARDREVMNSGKQHVTAEEHITTSHGNVRLLRTTKVPVLDKQEQPRYLLAYSEDITDRKATEQQLRQAVKMEAVGQLTGGIAHDFNNLLGVIIGNLDLLIERMQSDMPLKGLAEEALDGALRGAELVQRLLAFSRKQSLQPSAMNLNERLPQVVGMLRRTLGEQIELKLNCAADLYPALTDASQTEEAILNLAINARDAMPNGGTLTIETANIRLDEEYTSQHTEVLPGEYVLLAVSDTGSGMSADVLERAFEPFFSTKGVGKGSGLGLSMVYGFVKQTGGHVKIYSELGFGTTVKIYLPRANTTQNEQGQIEQVEANLAKGNELILMVEDNERMRAVTLKQLTDLGYRNLAAENAKAALVLLDQHPEIDLLFTDVIMPGGMTGCELAREVKKRRPSLKILLTSGYTAQAVANGCHDLAGLELLQKPFRKSDLAAKLRHMLDKSNSCLQPTKR